LAHGAKNLKVIVSSLFICGETICDPPNKDCWLLAKKTTHTKNNINEIFLFMQDKD
jgi:hypothetical protein